MSCLVINIFIVLLYLSILVNAITAAELGASSCRYLGDIDPQNYRCHKDAVKLKKIPLACTALVFDGVTCNDEFVIYPSYDKTDIDLIKQLVEFSPNVYLFYGHDHLQSWFEAVDPRKTIAEAQKVKEFVTEYPVAGLILKGIYYDYNIHPDYHVPNDFYVKLKAYVETMKIEIPNLKIGLYLEALSMMFYSKDPKSPDWFDFTVLNKVMDNYIIGFDRFNECTFYLLNGGVVPLNSTDPSINTLTKFKAAFDGSSIARDKVYFEFSINPSVTKKFEKYFIPCEVSYNEYCENQGEYKDCMCVDNQDTFFEKGKFTKENSKGFIAKFIDLVDRDLKCECNDDKYITFTMMLNGYNNLEKLTCAKLSGS